MAGDLDHRGPLPGDGGLHFLPRPTDYFESDVDEMQSLAGELLDEPLLDVSLGSKELFHSNLIARLCLVHPDAAERIFAPWLVSSAAATAHFVKREYKNTDLVVGLPGYEPILIENKAFSLPDEAQLDRYAREVAPLLGGGAVLLLLSLADPLWTDDLHRSGDRVWRRISYAQLGERMSAEFWDRPGFDTQILAHEGHFLGLLDRLVNATTIKSTSEPLQLPADLHAILEPTGLTDAVAKLRTYQLRQEIAHSFDGSGLSPTLLEASFTRGQPLLSAYWEKPNGDLVGWQLQGRQWRLAMVLRSLSGRGPEAGDARARFAAAHLGWFSFDPLHEILGQPIEAAEPAREFNKFDPDFVYQYAKLDERTPVSVLLELAVAYGQRAEHFSFAK